MKIILAGCIIINEKLEILLLKKIKHEHYELPGGKVEEGESIENAAIREAFEELGVNVKLEKYIGYGDFEIDNCLFRGHQFLAKIKKRIPKVMESDKFEKLFWMPIVDYKKYKCSTNVGRFCKKYLEKM